MRKTQIGWVVILIIVILNIFVFIQLGNPSQNLIMAGVSLLVLLVMGQLTIVVNDDSVKFYMGIGLIRGRYQLHDIEYCRPVRYFSLGWGIRFLPGIILFNVSGNRAIELSVNGKSRKIWIGTNDPDTIVDYINARLHS
jgi:hypothetical protein